MVHPVGMGGMPMVHPVGREGCTLCTPVGREGCTLCTPCGEVCLVYTLWWEVCPVYTLVGMGGIPYIHPGGYGRYTHPSLLCLPVSPGTPPASHVRHRVHQSCRGAAWRGPGLNPV